MSTSVLPAPPSGFARAFGWKRVLFTLIFSFALGSLVGIPWQSGWWSAVERVVLLGFVAMGVFSLFEQWPKRLPSWIARWVLQVVGVAVSMPLATVAIYVLSTDPGALPFYKVPDRMEGFSVLCGLGIFLSPWIALGAGMPRRGRTPDHGPLASAERLP